MGQAFRLRLYSVFKVLLFFQFHCVTKASFVISDNLASMSSPTRGGGKGANKKNAFGVIGLIEAIRREGVSSETIQS